MTTSERIEKWIKDQEEAGKTRDEIAGTMFVHDNMVCELKKSGKTKYNLKCTVGKVVHFFD